MGAVLNVKGVENVRKLQEIAVKETRLGIPLLFGFDVIHGHKTFFQFHWAKQPVGIYKPLKNLQGLQLLKHRL